jgi:hypothetical protein
MDDLSLRLFRLSSAGFCCAQIMYLLALEDEGKENEDLIKSAQALCRGINNSQQTCGVLSAGLGVLGLYAAKSDETQSAHENYKAMMDAFSTWFVTEFGASKCCDLIGVRDFNGPDQSYKPTCASMIQKSYVKLYEILTENGYTYGTRE